MIDYGLAGRVALVTGASRGIGRAVAAALARAGARVAICARDAPALEAARADLASAGDVFAVPCDVRSRASVDAMVEAVRARLGPIAVLVNNAGITSRLGLSDISDAHWDDVMNTNLKSVLFCCQAVVGDMKAARWGRILNCSSYGARHSRIERGVYSASKAALNTLTQIWAGELGPYGITVNAYAPGDIKTEMMADVLATPAGAALTRNIVLGRLGEAEEVADVVLYLASERASYVTGAVVEVTGGKFVVQNPQDAWPASP